jgi:hypothetical protein
MRASPETDAAATRPLSDRFEPAIFKLICRPRKQPTVVALIDDQNIIIMQMRIMAVLQHSASNFYILGTALLVPPSSRHGPLYRGGFGSVRLPANSSHARCQASSYPASGLVAVDRLCP